MKRMILKLLVSAVTLLATLAATSSANAIAVVGRWDPQYGAPFNGPDGVLGWKGTAEWFLPDACSPQAVSPSGTFVSNASACSAGGMFLQSATVEFYDFGADPTGLTSHLATLTFGVNSAAVNGMTLSGSSVLGVNTGLSSALTPVGTSFDGIDDYSFALKFTGDVVQLYFALNDQPYVAFSSSSSYNHHDDCDADSDKKFATHKKKHHDCSPPPPEPCDIGDIAAPRCGVNDPSHPAKATFSVPEPTTYALILAGLAAVGFTTRPRRQSR